MRAFELLRIPFRKKMFSYKTRFAEVNKTFMHVFPIVAVALDNIAAISFFIVKREIKFSKVFLR